MKDYLRYASVIAIAISTATVSGLAPASAAEEADTTQPQTERDADLIVVTGSLIRGTPENAALPVEVYSRSEIEQQGSPSALEFAKDLTIAGPTSGESYYFGGPQLTGSVLYNLRNLGTDKTLVLLNGRRMSQNTANMPSLALERVEILKDGAAVTYGADAVGGVVNFITRKHFVGLEATSKYKLINDSDGDYNVGVLGGIGSGPVNLMASFEYEHRSRLKAIDRGFVRDSLDPSVQGYNPAPWSIFTGLPTWIAHGPLPTEPSASNEFGPAIGSALGFTHNQCVTLGGRDDGYTCSYNYIPYYDIVSPTDTYRAFIQLNAEVTPDMNFHLDATYGRVKVPEIFGSPSQPIVQGPAMATGYANQVYVPITNPYAASFAAANGLAAASGFTAFTYRALSHGGNPALSDDGFGVPDRIDNKVWRISGGIEGRLGDWAGFAKDINYDASITYNQSRVFTTHPDTLGFRLQQALNGFGGPNCNAADLDPNRFGTQNPAAAGVGGCMWWNPFGSSFAGQPVTGAVNTGYVAGTENPADLIRWLFDERAVEENTNTLTVDLVFSGSSGIQLPGGNVTWALGGQYRTYDSRVIVPSNFNNGTTQCQWPDGFTSTNGVGTPPLEANPAAPTDPGFRGCTPDAQGPFVLFKPIIPTSAKQTARSVYGEINLPLFDTLNLTGAVRHESFTGDLSATVYKVSGKFTPLNGPLTLRASYGTNFTTPPPDLIPGQVTSGARNYTIAGSNWLGATFVTDDSLKPETATSWNIGAILEGRGFGSDHRFQIIVDYFNIKTKDEIGQVADVNQIANLVFNGPGGTISTCDPAVQPLLNRVNFNVACAVGLPATGAFSSVATLIGNGPGQSTNGIDLQAMYTAPVGAGDLTLNLNATRVLGLKTGATSLDGVVISNGDDRNG
ncbi:MAG: TonB-dependent receptor, partial [Sphingobium sp.]